MNRLVQAFERFSGPYFEKYQESMLTSHLKALSNISQCRTEAYGQWVNACTSCGLVAEEVNGACRNRACPKCNNSQTEEWIDKAKSRLPSTSYYHLVFSVPSELREVARRSQKVFYEKLMGAVGDTLATFGNGDRQVHGQIGYMSFLHTWDSKLLYHPHVHVLLMGGYLAGDGKWIAVGRKVLFPIHALSKMYKTKLLTSLREALGENIPSSFWKLPFVVHSEKTLPGSTHVIEYLGRYVKRIGLGPSRILSVDKEGVTLKYRHRHSRHEKEWRTMWLPGEEFIRRYLQHVLPKGFVRVRYYGLCHHNCAGRLEKIREAVNGVQEKEMGEEAKKEEQRKNCKECAVPLVTLLVSLPAFFRVRQERAMKFYLYNRDESPQVEKEEKEGMERLPYNKLIEPIARGRHVACGASAAPVPAGRVRTGHAPPPCSRLISTLYGR